ncbi:MAG: hypothetical protein M1358_04600, partial [Chloroflexi bacterium]|nr:hypothetical protein [Chloroflexota bacterium]
MKSAGGILGLTLPPVLPPPALLGKRAWRGSAFADRFYGDTLSNRLDGGAGNDRLHGRAGADFLEGG